MMLAFDCWYLKILEDSKNALPTLVTDLLYSILVLVPDVTMKEHRVKDAGV